MDEVAEEGFVDPVLRCDSCQALVTRETIHKHGACIKCGNRRLRNLTVFDEHERKQMMDWGLTDFVKLFGVVNE